MTRLLGQFEPIWIGRVTRWARSRRCGAASHPIKLLSPRCVLPVAQYSGGQLMRDVDGHAPRAKLHHRRIPLDHGGPSDEALDIVGQLALAGEAWAIGPWRAGSPAPRHLALTASSKTALNPGGMLAVGRPLMPVRGVMAPAGARQRAKRYQQCRGHDDAPDEIALHVHPSIPRRSVALALLVGSENGGGSRALRRLVISRAFVLLRGNETVPGRKLQAPSSPRSFCGARNRTTRVLATFG